MRTKPKKTKGVTVRANRSTELKPHVIPDEMVVVIDTREQTPLWMPRPPKGLVIMRDTLKNGDYSIKGHENSFAIERKNSDLFAFLTSERAKTKEKLIRLEKYEFKALVIEYHEDELFMPQLFTNISPEVVRQSLVSFEVKYGLHVYYGTKSDIERKVLDWMVYYFNYKRGGSVK